MTSPNSGRIIKAAALASGGMLLWTVIESIGPAAGVSAYQVVWTRYATHLLFMLAVFGPRYGRRLVATSRPVPLVLRSLCMLGMPLCFIAAAQRIPHADVTAVFWTAPALIMGLAAFVGEQSTSVRGWVSVLAGFAGVLLFTSAGAGLMRPGAIAALGMAFCFAAYVVLTRRLDTEPVMTRLFHSALWVWLSLSVAMPFVWQRPSWLGLAAMIAIGLAGWVLPYAVDLAVDEVPAGILAPFFYTQFFWMAIMDWGRRGSAPGMEKIGGLVLIGASLLLVTIGGRRSGEQVWTASSSTPSSSG